MLPLVISRGERGRERGREGGKEVEREGEREREREREREKDEFDFTDWLLRIYCRDLKPDKKII